MTIEKARKYFEKNGEIWVDSWKLYDGVQFKHSIYRFTEWDKLEQFVSDTKKPWHATPITRTQGKAYTNMYAYGRFKKLYVVTDKWHYVNHEAEKEIEMQEQALLDAMNGF